MKIIELPFVGKLEEALEVQGKRYIQVLVGPRQVGKTTGIRQLLERRPSGSYTYCSADGILPRPADWLRKQWIEARSTSKALLVVDEIQKVENWSAVVKEFWDAQVATDSAMDLLLLGSGSLTIQRGLVESLAGRYRLHRVFHWSWEESEDAYGMDMERYLLFGGYPGSYPLISNPVDWLGYIRESIVEAVIGKDILGDARVKSPALFRQCFDIICSYPAQEISYTKLLGQLQERGNTDLVKHYLELFEGAFLVKQLFKYSGKKVLRRSSSPKLMPLCPALYSVGLDAQLNDEERGRAFELAVGAALLRLPGRLFYWREGSAEVDFVYEYGKTVVAVEVKSGRKKSARGLSVFQARFPHAKSVIVTPENFLDLPRLVD